MLRSRHCWPLFVAACSAIGCNPGPEPIRTDQVQAYMQTKDRPAYPVPKTVDEAAKIGIPVYPGAMLGEGENTRLDDHSFARTYFVKMYAPGEVGLVSAYYLKGLKQARKLGGAEELQILGKNVNGDDIDVRIGPAADKTKSLVMVWMSQAK